MPLVSVVLPVYNGAACVGEALDSLLAQTWTDAEFLVIDDGSTDETGEILREYAHRDARIRLLCQENRGLVPTLNRGFTEAAGELIARMDADDISLPERLARQAAFLQAHPEVGVVGSAVVMFFADGDERVEHYPALPGVARWRLLYANPLPHPAVMLRKTVWERAGGYDTAMRLVEDYDLWERASRFTKLVSLPEPLLRYRVHPGSISRRHREEQQRRAAGIRRRAMAALLGAPVDEELAWLAQYAWGAAPPELVTLRNREVAALMVRLYRQYVQDPSLTDEERRGVRQDLAEYLWALLRFRLPGAAARLAVTGMLLNIAPEFLIVKLAGGGRHG